MIKLEQYECPKCGKNFMHTKGGFINHFINPKCPKCGHKLSILEQAKCQRFPNPFKLFDIIK